MARFLAMIERMQGGPGSDDTLTRGVDPKNKLQDKGTDNA